MIGSRRAIASAAALAVAAVGWISHAEVVRAQGPALTTRASVVGASADASLTIELRRWSTDAERELLLTAFTAPAPEPAEPPGGRGRGGLRGRGRGGPPPSPAQRLLDAVRAAPTVGFIWGEGPTGYSIKYAWHAALPEGPDRVVLVTDRRLGAHSTAFPAPSGALADAGFTLIEMRIDDGGHGEAKASLTSEVVMDAAANTLALEAYDTAPVLLRVMP